MSRGPLHLPGLDQLVPLDRGEAGLLAQAVAAHVLDMRNAPGPLPATSVLTCLPLVGLARKLHQLHERELATPRRPSRRPPKPRTFRISYDQLAALMHHRTAIGCEVGSPLEKLHLQGVIGKFQQKSLNLTQYLNFS